MAKRELLDQLDVSNAGRGSIVTPAGPDLNQGWQPIIRVSGDSERARGATVVVSADIAAPGDLPPGQNPRIIGRVKWGQEGAQALAYFDVGPEGTVLSVHSSFIEVDAKNAELPGIGFLGIGVSGFAAYESRSGAPFNSAKRTIQGVVPAGGNVIASIPPFSAYLTTFPFDLAIGPLVGDYLDSANTPIGQFPVPGFGGFFEIPGGARRIQISSAAAVAVGISVIFGLRI